MYIDLRNAADGTAYPVSFRFGIENGLFAERGISFGEAAAEGSYVRSGGKVGVNAEILVELRYSCDSCLCPAEKSLRIAFSEVFEPGGEYKYENNIVELDKAFTDAIILNTPSKLLCCDECKGLCPVCGCNRNHIDCGCRAGEGPFAILNSYMGGAKNGGTKN